ncbi:FxSxx-COOH system tetratricopeptide repeat protein [Dactylosporangium matsuzakiense]|uniref:NTPase n=1 Tax=Dactylosporangium matsuzakiense TaxID=53360 RepID=A0A9W6KAD6_9ACTN|nr:FxSxx-COOH system tetratricopeptide repeat protein [Dactylosporangium matsuzakiense]UWZ47095.1 tetratricopeptide repeat protein [Dactylosporangium matsuzakiense]GLK98470.1 NTPase [Dactylosporangium matsuzakiense]
MSTSGTEATTTAKIIAFVSPAPGAGRTNALTNIAWILAAANRRVLVIDWCVNTPRVADFVRPFQAGSLRADQVLPADVVGLLHPIGPGAPTVQTYHLTAARAELTMISSDQAYPAGGDGAIGLRRRLGELPFDYVFIDAPQELGDAAVQYCGRLCDTVVVCAPERRLSALQQVNEIARKLAEAAIARIRVLAMPQYEFHASGRAGSVRQIKATLGPLRDEAPEVEAGRLEFEIVEVPGYRYDTYQHVLSVLADEPEIEDLPLAAYLAAARQLSGDQQIKAPAINPDVRRRYLRSVQLDTSGLGEQIVVKYPPACRQWADWAVEQLTDAGAQVWRKSRPASAGDRPCATLVVVDGSEAVAGPADDGDAPGETYWLVVAGEEPTAVGGAQLVDLRDVGDAERARARLLSTFGLFPLARGAGAARARLPGELPPLFIRVPERSRMFTGRSASLEMVKDELAEHPKMTLTGGPGVGKSELAREFVYRFAHEYDLVCWIQAQNPGSLRAGLTALGKALNVPETVGGAAEAALQELGRRERWLLVYDNAESFDALRGFLPVVGAGHTLITSRDYGEFGLPSPLEISGLRREESIELLRGRVGDLDERSADGLADRLADLPLALQVAASLLVQYIRLLRGRGRAPEFALQWSVRELMDRLRDADGAVEDSLSRAMTISIAALRRFGSRQAELILGLAELVAFLSPDGVSMRLLRSRPMLVALAAAVGRDEDMTLFEADDVDRALLEGARFGLFEVAWGRPDATLVMHRAVQQFVRDRMPEPILEQRRRQALRGLAHYSPTDLQHGDPQLRYRFDELQPHLDHTEAWRCPDLIVRQWIVAQVQHLYRNGDGEPWPSALDVAKRALAHWIEHPLPDPLQPDPQLPAGPAPVAAAPLEERPLGEDEFGEDDDLAEDDEPGRPTPHQSLIWRLQTQIANLHRGLGAFDRAGEVDSAMLDEQLQVLGRNHRATLTTMRGLGGDLRGLGSFREARSNDAETLYGFKALLGEEHPETRMAAHNYAVAAYLAGATALALELEEQEFEARRRLFGDQDPRTWRCAGWVGTFERDLGYYERSRHTLTDARQRMSALLTPDHPDELAIRRTLAVTYRRLGQHDAAKILSAEVYKGYHKLFGENHPHTRAARMNLAIDYYRAGDNENAVHLAEFCKRGLQQRLGEQHPFVAVAAIDLSLFHSRQGQLDLAFRESAKALESLQDRLGRTHPWTMAASTDHAGQLTLRGEFTLAEELQRDAFDRYVRVYGREHPYTRVAEQNLNLIREAQRAGAMTRPPTDLADIDIEIPQT